MAKDLLHPELRAFFDAHRDRTCQCRQEAHESLKPLRDGLKPIRAHIHDLEDKLEEAEAAAGSDRLLVNKCNSLHTRIDAAKIRLEAARVAWRDLVAVLAEIERGFEEDEIQLTAALAHREVVGADGTTATPLDGVGTVIAPAVPATTVDASGPTVAGTGTSD